VFSASSVVRFFFTYARCLDLQLELTNRKGRKGRKEREGREEREEREGREDDY